MTRGTHLLSRQASNQGSHSTKSLCLESPPLLSLLCPLTIAADHHCLRLRLQALIQDREGSVCCGYNDSRELELKTLSTDFLSQGRRSAWEHPFSVVCGNIHQIWPCSRASFSRQQKHHKLAHRDVRTGMPVPASDTHVGSCFQVCFCCHSLPFTHLPFRLTCSRRCVCDVGGSVGGGWQQVNRVATGDVQKLMFATPVTRCEFGDQSP